MLTPKFDLIYKLETPVPNQIMLYNPDTQHEIGTRMHQCTPIAESLYTMDYSKKKENPWKTKYINPESENLRAEITNILPHKFEELYNKLQEAKDYKKTAEKIHKIVASQLETFLT